MRFNRFQAQPNKWTFTIPPIRKLVGRIVGTGRGWVDPFAGMNSPAEFTNDLNPESPAISHLPVEHYARQIDFDFNGILWDPPYSPRQIKECYDGLGLDTTWEDTASVPFWSAKRIFAKKLVVGGLALSFGWNSNGFGKNLGFEIQEVWLIAHGCGHNDTIVVLEKKMQCQLGAEQWGSLK